MVGTMVAGGGIGFDVSASACSAVLIATGKSATGWRLLTSFANAIVLSISASTSCFNFIMRAPFRLTLHQTGIEASSSLRKGQPRGLVSAACPTAPAQGAVVAVRPTTRL